MNQFWPFWRLICLSYEFLKLLMEVKSGTEDGSPFQSFAPLRQEFWQRSSFARGTMSGIWDFWCRVICRLFLSMVNSGLVSMSRNPLRHFNVSIASPLSVFPLKLSGLVVAISLGKNRECQSCDVLLGVGFFLAPQYLS